MPYGLYADDYAAAVRETGNVWAVSVVDLDAEASAAVQTVQSGGLPYYKERSGTTDRAPVSSSTAVLAVTLDSRRAMSAASAVIAFDSDENRTLILTIQ